MFPVDFRQIKCDFGGVGDGQSTLISCVFSLFYKKINHWAYSSDFILRVVVSTINYAVLFQLLIDIVTFDAFLM